MNRSIIQVDQYKRPVMFFVLVAISAGIAVFAGKNLEIQTNVLFYGLVFGNVLLFAYLLLPREPVYSVLIYLYSLTFLNLYWRIVLPGRLPDLDIPRLIFTFMWVIFLLEIATGTRSLLPRTNAEVSMLILIIALIVSMVTAHTTTYTRMFLNGYAIPFAAFVYSKNVLSSRESIEKLVKYYAVPLAIYFPLTNIFQRYGISKLVFPPYILKPSEVGARSFFELSGRATGTFLQPSVTSFAMISTYLLTLWFTSRSPSITGKIYAIVLTALVPVGVFFSYTRSDYAAFFISMLLLAVLSKRLKILSIAVIVAVMLAVLANWENVKSGKREAGGLAIKETAQARTAIVYASGQMFLDKPFTGFGFERYRDYLGSYLGQVRQTALGYRQARIGKGQRIHNYFLSIMVELGLMGIVPLILIYYFLGKYLLHALRRDCPLYDRDFVVTVIAIFAIWLTIAMFIELRFFEFMNAFLMTVAGIVIGAQQKMDLGLLNNPEKGE